MAHTGKTAKKPNDSASSAPNKRRTRGEKKAGKDTTEDKKVTHEGNRKEEKEEPGEPRLECVTMHAIYPLLIYVTQMDR